MTQHPSQQNNIVRYGNIVSTVLLLILFIAQMTPVTAASKGGIWIVVVAAILALAGYRDAIERLDDPKGYGLHALWTILFILGVDFLTAFIEYEQQTEASLTIFLSTVRSHLTMFTILIGVLLAGIIGYVIGAAAAIIQRALGKDIAPAKHDRPHRPYPSDYRDGRNGSLEMLLNVLGLAGRHPLIFLALYRLHAYYAFLWNGAPAVLGYILQCLYMLVLICVLLRIQQIYHVRLCREDTELINAIGDLYWDHIQVVDVVFYVVATLIFAVIILQATMFEDLIDDSFFSVACVILCNPLFLVALSRFWDDKERYLTTFQCSILFVGSIIWGLYGTTLMLVLCLLIVAAEGTSAQWIMRLFLIVSVIMLTAAAWASVHGYIRYYANNGLHAMGIYYRTDYATYWLYIMLIYRVLRGGRMRLAEYIGATALMTYVYHLTEGRTAILCTVLFLGMCLLVDYWPAAWRIDLFSRMVYHLGLVVYPLCAAGSYAIVAILGPSVYAQTLDGTSFWYTMKSRVLLSYQGFITYPIRLFGQVLNRIKDNTGLLASDQTDITYFTLDSSYVRYLLQFGIAFMLMIIGINIYLAYRCGKEHNMILLCALAVIAIHSISEPHMANIYHNVLLVLTFATWDMQRMQEQEIETDTGIKVSNV